MKRGQRNETNRRLTEAHTSHTRDHIISYPVTSCHTPYAYLPVERDGGAVAPGVDVDKSAVLQLGESTFLLEPERHVAHVKRHIAAATG